MIKIQDNIKPPKRNKPNQAVTSAINKYQRLYRLVYGKEPEVNYINPWLRVEGQKDRVKLSRLKEMVKQLERRIE